MSPSGPESPVIMASPRESATLAPAREWRARLALLGLSTLLALLVAEVGARVLRARQHGGKEGGEEALYQEYDPLLGWRKKKNTTATYRRREYTVTLKTNSYGLRDPERAPEAAPGIFRVLALGDSFVEGYTVDLPLTLTQRLESRLNALGCPAEVINGGTAAYSTDQEYLFYRSEGVRYVPSLVLLFFYWNDVLYSDRQDYFLTPKPVFEMGGGKLHLHRYPVREVPKQKGSSRPEKTQDEQGGSALLDMVRERLWVGAPAVHDGLARLGLWNPIAIATPRLEMLVYDRRDLAPIEDAWEKVEAIARALQKEVLDHGSTLALVYIPARMEIQEASWNLTRRLYGLAENAWERSKVRRKIERMSASLGAPMIDLSPALEAADQPFRPTYFTFDGHFNGRGHDVAAGAVFDWMRRSRSLPGTCPGGALKPQAASAAVWDPEAERPPGSNH